MGRSIITIAREALVDHLIAKWGRTALATYTNPVTVADPGHGLDPITPVALGGQHGFDATLDADCAPFTAVQVWSGMGGTGYLVVDVKPDGEAQTKIPGEFPLDMQPARVMIEIVTPEGLGHLEDQYAAALRQIFSPGTTFTPAENGLERIVVRRAPAMGTELGTTGSTRHTEMAIDVELEFTAQAAIAA